MKAWIVLMLMVFAASVALGQQEKRDIHKGNQLYLQKKYAEAEALYQKSVSKTKTSVPGNFNLGDAFYKQKKFDNAAQQFTELAASAKDKILKAKAYHNLGNTLLESKKLEESIEAYKKSLMSNPSDEETRYNLAYAQEMLKKQQQQNKNNKNQNKDQKNKDQKKDQQNKEQKDQGKDQKDKDKQDQQNKDQNKKDQDKKDQQNGDKPQPDKLSKEDAERMLDALNHEEKNTQDKLKNKKGKGVKGRIVKDW